MVPDLTLGESGMKGNLRNGVTLGALLLLSLCAIHTSPGQTAPLTLLAAPTSDAPHIIRAGACREGCGDDCSDCPTEIDIAPPPRDDPIAREIERFGPAPLSHPCETRDIVTRGRRATHNYDACGIRCWYWRLRHGYCGPGCEYYKYRMYHYGRDEPPFRHPRYVCGS
jgi:hypothetical protein